MILDYLFSLLLILSLAILGFNGVDQFPVVMPAVPYRLNISFHKRCIVEVIQFKIVDFLFSQLPISSLFRSWFHFVRQLCRGDLMILDYLFSLLPILSLAILELKGFDQFPVVMPALSFSLNIFFHKECIVEVIQSKIVDLLFSQLSISFFFCSWFHFGRQLCRGDQMFLVTSFPCCLY